MLSFILSFGCDEIDNNTATAKKRSARKKAATSAKFTVLVTHNSFYARQKECYECVLIIRTKMRVKFFTSIVRLSFEHVQIVSTPCF